MSDEEVPSAEPSPHAPSPEEHAVKDHSLADGLVRVTFFASEPAKRTELGWRIEGEPGYAPAFWASPGDVFDQVASTSGDRFVAVNLVVVELGPTHVELAGEGAEHVVTGDVLSGYRTRSR